MLQTSPEHESRTSVSPILDEINALASVWDSSEGLAYKSMTSCARSQPLPQQKACD